MKRFLIILAVCGIIATVMLARGQDSSNPVNPYPGGSPFPMGHEPSLTHTATAFWITQDGMATEIEVKAAGDRATQFKCWKWKEGKKDYVTSSIAQQCRYHVLLSSSKAETGQGVQNIVADGFGELEVLVHGFKREDFTNPPTLTVIYSKNSKEIGRTAVATHPTPEKLK
jgi:hypothetical protein